MPRTKAVPPSIFLAFAMKFFENPDYESLEKAFWP
jgi:hypothetical protein